MGKTKKQRRETRESAGPGPPLGVEPPPRGQWSVALATLGGVGVLLAMTYSGSREIDRLNDSLDGSLKKIETRISQLADKVDKLPAQAQRPRRGPDPNKVYQIKTAGSPAKGPASAPVTVAEFSDFQ